MRRWSEPADLPLLLSQTTCNWSLAAVEEDVDSAAHDVAAQCGAGDKLKFQIGPPQCTYDVVLSFVDEEMV